MPSISVIVPIYKVEPYLRACIDSILAQTFTDFELILVDDGSPDACGAICDEYAVKDSRVHVIHQENGGLSAARNAGIDWAFANTESQYLTFIDSDDMIHPQMLEGMLRAMRSADAEIAVCAHKSFSGAEQPLELESGLLPRCLTNREACERLYDNDGAQFTTACGKVYHSRLFQTLRFPVGRIHEDEATTYQALYASNQVIELSEKYYYYRVNPDSIMNSAFSERRFDALEAIQERIAFFEAHNEEKLAEKTAWFYRTHHAKLIVFAEAANRSDCIPSQYRMRLSSALRCLRKELPDDKYTYYLSMVRPKWLLPHAYWRKIKSCFQVR